MFCVVLALLSIVNLVSIELVNYAVRNLDFIFYAQISFCSICFVQDELVKMDAIFVLCVAC
jgi:hypothetical protein